MNVEDAELLFQKNTNERKRFGVLNVDPKSIKKSWNITKD